MTVDTAKLKDIIRELYRRTTFQALDDPSATIEQLETRAHKIKAMYWNDLCSIQNVETMAASWGENS